MVRVYGKPACVQCDYTKKKLDENGIPYTYHDVTVDEQARKFVQETGKTQLPVVVARLDTKSQMWHGFSPDKITALRACY